MVDLPSATEKMLAVLACPTCGASLSGDDEHAASCESCGRRYPISDGVFVAQDNDYYWGEITQDEMQAANAAAAQRGVRTALDELVDKYPFIKHYALGQNRADWRFNLPEHNKGRVLDIGSGWGAIPFLLCDHYEEVWSCEYVTERIEWQNIRKREEGRANLRLVQANLDSLPFRDDSFDLISLNGVLEWMGLARAQGNPRDIQVSVLRDCHRKLRRPGFLYIGIENRIGWKLFLGHQDHSGLPFTSLMPRWLASLWLKAFKRDVYRTTRAFSSYRTYTYSPAGYRRLLREAGFADVDMYWVSPGYNEPEAWGTLADTRSIIEYYHSKTWPSLKARALKRVLVTLCRFGFQRCCAPMLLIYAAK